MSHRGGSLFEGPGRLGRRGASAGLPDRARYPLAVLPFDFCLAAALTIDYLTALLGQIANRCIPGASGK